MVRLIEKNPTGILARDLPLGKLAVIINWEQPQYMGKVVQRVDDDILLCIGIPSKWDTCSFLPESCWVKILETGDTLVVWNG
jgi:hypothetical protein